ncbi:MAG: hypothetical protein HY590_02135 [Candidatus Omnitrophica bacterium]|nr:hypothetical protein [Candidatus Omnitrophota bacterium]
MKRIRPFLLLLILFASGCSASSTFTRREYRDPLTYSFEAYSTPYVEQGPFVQLMNSVKETSRQIREWEKKHLW